MLNSYMDPLLPVAAGSSHTDDLSLPSAPALSSKHSFPLGLTPEIRGSIFSVDCNTQYFTGATKKRCDQPRGQEGKKAISAFQQ